MQIRRCYGAYDPNQTPQRMDRHHNYRVRCHEYLHHLLLFRQDQGHQYGSSESYGRPQSLNEGLWNKD